MKRSVIMHTPSHHPSSVEQRHDVVPVNAPHTSLVPDLCKRFGVAAFALATFWGVESAFRGEPFVPPMFQSREKAGVVTKDPRELRGQVARKDTHPFPEEERVND